MLTPLEARNIEICTKKKTTGATNAELAEKYGLCQSSIEKVIAWGERRGLFFPDDSKITFHIQDHRKRLKEIDRTLRKIYKTHKQKEQEGDYKLIYRIARLEDTRLRIARRIEELEGIQKEIEPAPQVNINILNQKISIFLKNKYPEAWEELRGMLLNEYNNNGQS